MCWKHRGCLQRYYVPYMDSTATGGRRMESIRKRKTSLCVAPYVLSLTSTIKTFFFFLTYFACLNARPHLRSVRGGFGFFFFLPCAHFSVCMVPWIDASVHCYSPAVCSLLCRIVLCSTLAWVHFSFYLTTFYSWERVL